MLRAKKLNCTVWKNSLHWDTHAATKRQPSGGQPPRSHTGLPLYTQSSPSFPEVRTPRTNNRTTDVASTAYRANQRLPSQRVPGRASRRPSWAARRRSNTTRAKKHAESGHTHTVSQTCRERDGREKKKTTSRVDPAFCTL